MEPSTRTRRSIAALLAVVLAVETVSIVAAAVVTRTVTHDLPADPPAGVVLAADTTQPGGVGAVVAGGPRDAPAAGREPDVRLDATLAAVAPTRVAHGGTPAADTIDEEGASPTTGTAPTAGSRVAALAARAATTGRSPSGPGGSPASYRGTNHVWIPSLGINRSVHWFPCDRERPPDNYVYRWGCAGANNVYLMGHAASVMKPLHDAYTSGRLRKGMKAWYADATGKVRAYAVAWWKVTAPTTEASWAWAPQSRPSMTLQTCVGKNSQYRLMVRLVQVTG